MILSTRDHELQHKSQLMVVERMLGIVPHSTRGLNAMIDGMRSAANQSSLG